jgi:hypothetical protein
MFFPGASDDMLTAEDGTFFKKFIVTREGEQMLGIAVRSEENRKSNGGHVDDDYFDTMRATMPAEWVARYLDCSFASPTGKVYKAYQLDSVHNVRRFQIPGHWSHTVSIDVGGAHPWAILDNVMDDQGNIITVANLHKPGLIASEVAKWIKDTVPDWKTARYIIDPENKLAMLELREYGIHCSPAIKTVQNGITRVMGRMQPRPENPLPDWYKNTQGKLQYDRFREGGSPSWFVFEDARETRHELHGYVYDEHGKPKKEKDDAADSLRYAIMSLPQPGRRKYLNTPRENLRKVDPVSAREWDLLEQRITAREAAKKHGWSREEALEEAIIGSPRKTVAGVGEMEMEDAEERGVEYVEFEEMVD